MATINKTFGVADPQYDALRVQSNQAIWPDAGGAPVGGAGGLENKIYLWHTDGSTIDLFDPDETGLGLALAAAASGDTVWIPSVPIALTAGVTLPAGVMLRGIDSSATISLTANNATDYATLIGPASGIAYISHVTILCTNNGSGDAVAIDGAAGQIRAHDAYLSGQSTSGAGYGVRAAAGIITLDDCWILGSTTPLAGAITSAGYFIDDLAASGSITVDSGAGNLINPLTAGNWYAVECAGGPFNANPADPKDSYHYSVSNDGGLTWDGLLGADGAVMHLDEPAWGVNPVDLDGKHVRFFFQATTSSIMIRTGDFYWADNTGSLGWNLYNAHYSSGSTTGNIVTSACRMTPSAGEPSQGDRSAWDALNWAARHTNDTNNGIHHTLAALDARYLDAQANSIAPVGWLAGWRYRIPVTVANADGTYTNKKVPIDVNTFPLVEAAKANADLSDLRVTAADGVSLLPFYRANSALLFNKANFSRYSGNPVITSGGGGAWDNGWIHPYSVIDMQDGSYRMYYGGHPTPGDTNIPNKVGYATSNDGITWTKYGSNPIFSPGTAGQWDDSLVEHFQVIRVDATTWKAWYAGQTGSTWKVGYATSSDGVTWTRYGSNPVLSGTAATWDSASVLPSAVWIEGGTYYMIYWGDNNPSDQTTWKIGLATSPDGITWTKHASNPVLSGAGNSAWDAGVLDCDVIKVGSTYFMFYQGNLSDGSHSAIGLATSSDLVTWTRSSDNPWPRGTAGQWDDSWFEGPVITRIGAEYRFYYMGKADSGPTKSIGFMQFPDTRLWPIIPTLTSSGTTLFVYYGNASATDTSTGSAGSPDVNITVTNGAEQAQQFASWDDETQPDAHARDIDDATYTYHTSNGGDNTKFWRGDRTWSTVSAPTIALDDLSDVDTSGEATGDVIYDNAGTWQVYPLGLGSKITTSGTKIRFGNVGGGNYLEIDTSTGNLRLVGNATTWDDFRVEASIVKAGATAPSYKAFGPSGNLQALMFEAGHHDEAMFEMQMPHNWKEGSNIYPHVHWTPTTADAGNVVWELEYSWANIGGTFGAPSNMATDPTAAGGTAWVHKLTYLKSGGNNYIDATGKTLSSMLLCRIHRNSNSGSDTLNKDVALLEVDFHYLIDGFGSDEELVKDASASLLLESGDVLLLESGDKLLLE